MIVVLVRSQMPGQGIDALSQQRDLHIGRAGIASVEPVLLNDSGSVGLSNGHTSFLFLSLLLICNAEEYTVSRPPPCTPYAFEARSSVSAASPPAAVACSAPVADSLLVLGSRRGRFSASTAARRS